MRHRVRVDLEAGMAKTLDRSWISPNRLTILGLGLGIASAICAGVQLWLLAAILWLASRLLDGLDGALARVRRKLGRQSESGAVGFLDITADFVVYGATVFGVGIGASVGVKDTRTSGPPGPEAAVRFCSISGVCRWPPPTA